MKLERTTKQTWEILQIKKDWLVPSASIMEILTLRGNDICHWCGLKHAVGQQIALARIKGSKNKILCMDCVNQVQS